jgi:hypothetical protein
MTNKPDNRTNRDSKVKSIKQKDKMVDVLYQKLGDRWFAFSMIDDEIFVGSIPQSDIDSSVKVDRNLSHK